MEKRSNTSSPSKNNSREKSFQDKLSEYLQGGERSEDEIMEFCEENCSSNARMKNERNRTA